MKTETNKLAGAALDWAVAKCEGREKALEINRMGSLSFDAGIHPYMADLDKPGRYQIYSPSTKWEQGGPIIEREKTALIYFHDGGHEEGGEWLAEAALEEIEIYGPTALIAAMRCYVASKLGEEIDVPEELVDL
jgi:hypothetical protein